MTTPRILCVSQDRSTRATMTRALADTPVNVAIAQTSSAAIERLEYQSIDGMIIDGKTIDPVSELLDEVEARYPGTPTFVNQTDDIDETAQFLIDAISDITADRETTQHAVSAIESRTDELASERPLERVVENIKIRLADARSAGAVERALREVFVRHPRFAFAWIGEYDRRQREIVPWITNPSTAEWPMQRTFTIGDRSHPLLEQVIGTQTSQSVRQIDGNESRVPLGVEALRRGARSVVITPLATESELYGVLVVYTTGTITDDEHTAVDAVAETTSHALESIAVRGQLQQQERILRRYERLVETAGDGMYVLDRDGDFTTINDALVEMTGYSREGLLGEPISMLFGADGADRGSEIITQLLESEETTDTIEVSLQTKAGETIPCETQVAVLLHDDDDPATFHGSVGVVRDITSRKQREQTLSEQNDRLEAFARIVSHDLRNPLGVSQGYLDLIAETESFEYLEKVNVGLERMETIITDVLAIAREGEWASDTEAIDLESAVETAWENVSTESASIRVECETPTLITADWSSFLRLLENLFRNSVEHGGADVTVTVGTIGPSDAIEGFFVADDGYGLPPTIRNRAFDRSVSTGTDGLGIGLWVVRQVAEGHGWSVTAGESEDGGARFECYFE